MAKLGHSPDIEIVVDGEPYLWRLHRRPNWSGLPDDWHGMAISVHHKEGKREAVIEFPAGPRPRLGAPLLQASKIQPSLIAAAITSAIAAGWEPLSRGKTVNIVVDAKGG